MPESISLKRASAVLLQFSFSNSLLVPSGIRRLDSEDFSARQSRKSETTGVCAISKDQSSTVDLSYLRQDLEAANYILLSASTQSRYNPKCPSKPYSMVRFVFVHLDHLKLSFSGTKKVDEDAYIGLTKMALWQIRAYTNQSPDKPKQNLVSLNAEGRVPKYIAEDPGQPEMRRVIDVKTGEKLNILKPIRADKIACATKKSIFLF